MSRPTDFLLTKVTNQTPTPQQYENKVTNTGRNYLGSSTSINEQIRGTFGRDNRFRNYKINAYIISNPNLGPGTHEDHANFRKQKDKPCKVRIMHQDYHISRSLNGDTMGGQSPFSGSKGSIRSRSRSDSRDKQRISVR